MVQKYSIVAVMILLVVCLMGAVGQVGSRETWEYGAFTVFTAEIGPNIEAIRLGMSARKKETNLYLWSTGPTVISADNIGAFMLKVGCTANEKSAEVLINYLGSHGWELLDYEYNRHSTKSSASEGTQELTKYLFKRRQ